MENRLPRDSETFLMPAHTSMLDGEEVAKESVVCPVGLDVHYELNVTSGDTGSYRPRLRPFNPRISGPSMPYPYGGKAVKNEADIHSVIDDPVAFARLIEKQDIEDADLYKKKDPRRVSRCVVVRDYNCKIPVDLADTTKIAKAVLNHLPDQYVAFLGEFVSNLFGKNMVTFLNRYVLGLQSLLGNQEELNRLSWAVYKSVANVDSTLVWNQNYDEKMDKVNDVGKSIVSNVSPSEVYDLQPCIRQHIETLTRMKDDWCHGFASDEENVLAMMHWVNEKGKEWCDDLRLIDEHGVANYDDIRLHVPIGFSQMGENKNEPVVSGDKNPSIRQNITENAQDLRFTYTLAIPVGSWAGQTTNLFLSSKDSTANISWGFGHCATVMKRTVYHDGGTNHVVLRYPFLPFKQDGSTLDETFRSNESSISLTHVSPERWAITPDSIKSSLVRSAEKREAPSLRDTIVDDSEVDRLRAQQIFRGDTFAPSAKTPYAVKLVQDDNSAFIGSRKKRQVQGPDGTVRIETEHAALTPFSAGYQFKKDNSRGLLVRAECFRDWDFASMSEDSAWVATIAKAGFVPSDSLKIQQIARIGMSCHPLPRLGHTEEEKFLAALAVVGFPQKTVFPKLSKSNGIDMELKTVELFRTMARNSFQSASLGWQHNTPLGEDRPKAFDEWYDHFCIESWNDPSMTLDKEYPRPSNVGAYMNSHFVTYLTLPSETKTPQTDGMLNNECMGALWREQVSYPKYLYRLNGSIFNTETEEVVRQTALRKGNKIYYRGGDRKVVFDAGSIAEIPLVSQERLLEKGDTYDQVVVDSVAFAKDFQPDNRLPHEQFTFEKLKECEFTRDEHEGPFVIGARQRESFRTGLRRTKDMILTANKDDLFRATTTNSLFDKLGRKTCERLAKFTMSSFYGGSEGVRDYKLVGASDSAIILQQTFKKDAFNFDRHPGSSTHGVDGCAMNAFDSEIEYLTTIELESFSIGAYLYFDSDLAEELLNAFLSTKDEKNGVILNVPSYEEQRTHLAYQQNGARQDTLGYLSHVQGVPFDDHSIPKFEPQHCMYSVRDRDFLKNSWSEVFTQVENVKDNIQTRHFHPNVCDHSAEDIFKLSTSGTLNAMAAVMVACHNLKDRIYDGGYNALSQLYEKHMSATIRGSFPDEKLQRSIKSSLMCHAFHLVSRCRTERYAVSPSALFDQHEWSSRTLSAKRSNAVSSLNFDLQYGYVVNSSDGQWADLPLQACQADFGNEHKFAAYEHSYTTPAFDNDSTTKYFKGDSLHIVSRMKNVIKSSVPELQNLLNDASFTWSLRHMLTDMFQTIAGAPVYWFEFEKIANTKKLLPRIHANAASKKKMLAGMAGAEHRRLYRDTFGVYDRHSHHAPESLYGITSVPILQSIVSADTFADALYEEASQLYITYTNKALRDNPFAVTFLGQFLSITNGPYSHSYPLYSAVNNMDGADVVQLDKCFRESFSSVTPRGVGALSKVYEAFKTSFPLEGKHFPSLRSVGCRAIHQAAMSAVSTSQNASSLWVDFLQIQNERDDPDTIKSKVGSVLGILGIPAQTKDEILEATVYAELADFARAQRACPSGIAAGKIVTSTYVQEIGRLQGSNTGDISRFLKSNRIKAGRLVVTPVYNDCGGSLSALYAREKTDDAASSPNAGSDKKPVVYFPLGSCATGGKDLLLSHIVMLRDMITSTYGMFPAAVICESTFLRTPKIARFLKHINKDYPVPDADTTGFPLMMDETEFYTGSDLYLVLDPPTQTKKIELAGNEVFQNDDDVKREFGGEFYMQLVLELGKQEFPLSKKTVYDYYNLVGIKSQRRVQLRAGRNTFLSGEDALVAVLTVLRTQILENFQYMRGKDSQRQRSLCNNLFVSCSEYFLADSPDKEYLVQKYSGCGSLSTELALWGAKTQNLLLLYAGSFDNYRDRMQEFRSLCGASLTKTRDAIMAYKSGQAVKAPLKDGIVYTSQSERFVDADGIPFEITGEPSLDVAASLSTQSADLKAVMNTFAEHVQQLLAYDTGTNLVFEVCEEMSRCSDIEKLKSMKFRGAGASKAFTPATSFRAADDHKASQLQIWTNKTEDNALYSSISFPFPRGGLERASAASSRKRKPTTFGDAISVYELLHNSGKTTLQGLVEKGFVDLASFAFWTYWNLVKVNEKVVFGSLQPSDLEQAADRLPHKDGQYMKESYASHKDTPEFDKYIEQVQNVYKVEARFPPVPILKEQKDAYLYFRLNLDGGNPNDNSVDQYNELLYDSSDNISLFSALDAAGLLMNAAHFYNPSDCNRGQSYAKSKYGSLDGMHYWCRYMVESFLYAREAFKGGSRAASSSSSSTPFEFATKLNPQAAFPTSMIGKLSERSFAELFPHISKRSRFRSNVERARALSVYWGTTPGFKSTTYNTRNGAWMPLSPFHTSKLLEAAGLFDQTYGIPINPWCSHKGVGISRVYNQSYHSPYYVDSYKAEHFQDWKTNACKYQNPFDATRPHPYYPFSQYGGTPVSADFQQHLIEFPSQGSSKRHRQIMMNRFGHTTPMRLGQQFHDKGFLQDMCMPCIRSSADTTDEQRKTGNVDHIRLSNFMAYSRNHAIIALASCNFGTREWSIPRVVRNLFRLYVDCCDYSHKDESIPVVIGFLPSPVGSNPKDRPITLYAAPLSCINKKLEIFCSSEGNRGEKICQLYKQIYLNDAAILHDRLSRAERRKRIHQANFNAVHRQRNITWEEFLRELSSLQDAYIEFLHHTILGILIESGADLSKAPLHLLEPRELEVSAYEEDTDVVGNDFLTSRTLELVKNMDFSQDNLNRTQMAILSLIPPNSRILGTMRLDRQNQIMDLEHVRKQIIKDTQESNKKKYEGYIDGIISASLGRRILERSGPIDFSFDMSAIKDPVKESHRIGKHVAQTNKESTSFFTLGERGRELRQHTGPESLVGLNEAERERAYDHVRGRVEAERYMFDGSHLKCLNSLKGVPEHMKRILRKEYSPYE